jgi:hypothetical protein
MQSMQCHAMVVRYWGGGRSIWIHDQFLIAVHQGPNVPISLQVMLVQSELHHLSLMTMYIIGYITTLPQIRTMRHDCYANVVCNFSCTFWRRREPGLYVVKGIVSSFLSSFCSPCRLAYHVVLLTLFSEPNPTFNCQRLPLSFSLSHQLTFSEPNPPLTCSASHFLPHSHDR